MATETKTADPIKDTAKKVEAFAADSQKAMTAQMEKLAKGYETATAFNQETIDAVMKSSEITSKALEGINAEILSYSKKSFENGVAAAKDFAASKNVSELFEKQADFAKSSMDDFMKQSVKLNEMCMAAAKSAMEPVGARFSAATDVFKGFSA